MRTEGEERREKPDRLGAPPTECAGVIRRLRRPPSHGYHCALSTEAESDSLFDCLPALPPLSSTTLGTGIHTPENPFPGTSLLKTSGTAPTPGTAKTDTAVSGSHKTSTTGTADCAGIT